eukprot:1053342-Prymnesium_polylepis.1
MSSLYRPRLRAARVTIFFFKKDCRSIGREQRPGRTEAQIIVAREVGEEIPPVEKCRRAVDSREHGLRSMHSELSDLVCAHQKHKTVRHERRRRTSTPIL